MLSPYFINDSYIDQLFNQNSVSLLITRIQPGTVGFGNGIIKNGKINFQIGRLMSFTYQNQRNHYYQFTHSKQFNRFTLFFQNPNEQGWNYFAGFRVLPQNSFSAFIGNTQNKGHIITKQYLDMKILNNYCLSYFLDALKISQNLQGQFTMRICLPNYAQSDFRLRTVWKEKFIFAFKFDKQPQVEMGYSLPLSNSLYLSTLSNFYYYDNKVNTIIQFTWHCKGQITKFGVENHFTRYSRICPFVLLERVVFQDPNVILKCQYKNNKPSLQINFEYDSQNNN